jgi:predicted metal-binding protein
MAEGQSGVRAATIMAPSDVATAPWVRWKCQFGCSGYGRCLMCPPFTPAPEQTRQTLNGYHRAILIQFRPEASVNAIVVQLERVIFLKGFWKVLALGAGPCFLCKTCPVKGGRCRHAQRARPSMEACGIDVFSTVRKAGLPIEVVRDRQQSPDYYGLVLVD